MLRPGEINQISDRLNHEDLLRKGIEVEAKFGFYYDDGRFSSTVRLAEFNRLQERLEGAPIGFVPVVEQSTDYSMGDIRKRVVETSEGPRVQWQRKTRGPKVVGPIYDYGVRISVNVEEELEPVSDFEPTTIRVKQRKSYLFNPSVRVDTTHVQTSWPDSSTLDRTSYEVEIEILNLQEGAAKDKLRAFNIALQQVFQILYDTIVLYTVDERSHMISDVQKILGQKRGRWLDFGMVAQARNLKLRDMVWGGLAGNIYRNQDNPYSVTHKSDGLRKFLIIHRTGIWLAFPPYEYALLVRFDTGNHDLTLAGTILDGEVISLDQRRYSPESEVPRAYHWFLTFDMLADRGDKRIQFQPHSSRMIRASKTIHKMRDVDSPENKILTIHMKTFRQIKSPEHFFSLMREMFAQKALLPYDEDGFIFTPEATPYNPLRIEEKRLDRSLKHKDRILTHYPDICKWKPLSKLTIDFSIRWGRHHSLQLYALEDKRRDLEIFKGDNFHPFDNESMIDVSHPKLQALPTGTIVEFAWDTKKGLFRYYKRRGDKRHPNRLSVAIDDWQDIHNPIKETTLMGMDFVLMQRYHNRIKNNLFRQLASRSTLLDIGSGRGGDVNKWKRFSKIVAVEPNKSYRKELKRRIRLHNIEDRVLIVNARGQDTEIVSRAVKDFIGDKVDAVSMMLSLTFFWESQDTLKGLVETIDQNLALDGQILFLTMDGDTAEQVFDPYFPNYAYEKLIFHQASDNPDDGYAILKLQDVDKVDHKKRRGRKLLIYIQDSIVGSRKEHSSEPIPETTLVPLTSSISINSTAGEIKIRYTDAPVMRSMEPPVKLLPNRRVRYINAPIMYSRYTPERYKQLFNPSSFTVDFQEEYLVHLGDFKRLLGVSRRLEEWIYRADEEYFLSEAENRFSLFYSWGLYRSS